MSGPLTKAALVLDLALTEVTTSLDLKSCRVARYLSGEVPWDTCGEGSCSNKDGMLWAKLLSVTPSQGSNASGKCASYDWTAELGIVRCVAVGNGTTPPTVAQVQADSARQILDADTIFAALRCCADPNSILRDVDFTSWAPLGPNGGCAGGAWTVKGRLDVCC